MPGTTPSGLPYPLPTEPLAEGAAAIRALADALTAPEPWREVGAAGNPAFVGSFSNAGGTDATLAFYRDRSGMVHLKGLVKNTAAGNNLCTILPAGYRPAKTERLPTIGYTGTAEVAGRVDIDAGGGLAVFLVGVGTGAFANATIHGSFRAASYTAEDPESKPAPGPEIEPLD